MEFLGFLGVFLKEYQRSLKGLKGRPRRPRPVGLSCHVTRQLIGEEDRYVVYRFANVPHMKKWDERFLLVIRLILAERHLEADRVTDRNIVLKGRLLKNCSPQFLLASDEVRLIIPNARCLGARDWDELARAVGSLEFTFR